MSSLNKILNKVNQAQQALKSAKGIKSKIESISGSKGTTTDEVKLDYEKSERVLEQRRASLQEGLDSANAAKSTAKSKPAGADVEMVYPTDEILENYIVFNMRPRKDRSSNSGGKNLFSGETNPIIALHVPSDISSTTGVEFQASEVGGTVRRALSTFNGQGLDGQGLSEIMGGLSSMMTGLMNSMTGDAVNIIRGQATNPMEEMALKGVGFRDFEFTYEFLPRSGAEAKVVHDIIYTFKTAMLPDTFGAGGSSNIENFFNYPNIFDVEWEGPVQKVLDGFLPMVCTKCDVDYFGGGAASLYEEFDGRQYPVHTSMAIAFTEIKILSQETYQQISANPMATDIGGGNPSIIAGDLIKGQPTPDEQKLIDENNKKTKGTGGP
jgi:hypothetical protein